MSKIWDPVIENAKQHAQNVSQNNSGTQDDQAGSTASQSPNTTGAANSVRAGETGAVKGGLALAMGPSANDSSLLGNSLNAQKPTGATTYTVNAGNQPYVNQLNSLYDQIMNRKPFQYDLNGDLLYRQMADQYTRLGQQAMRDATGQAAALTGGYGNSYASQVGNQAYQQYLTALNQNLPELWDRAYQAYQNQGDQLLQQYQLAATHPEYLDAISPKTYTVTAGSANSDDTSADTSYLQALIRAGLAGSRTGAVNTYDYSDYLKRVMELQK